MRGFQETLNKTIIRLSHKNHEKSFAFFRLWLGIGRTHSEIPPDAVLSALRKYGTRKLSADNPIDPTAHLVLRFASDAESDHILAPHSVELRSRFCAETLQVFFGTDIGFLYDRYGLDSSYYTDANLVAHCINLGYVEEAVIHDHILQSLIFHPGGLYDHQVYALVILFKIAGATLAAYADPTVIDRCFEPLKGPRKEYWPRDELIQEVIALRERGWEGLPPPPVFKTWESKPTGVDRGDSAATPVVTSLGLPKNDSEPQIPQPPQLGSTTSEPDNVSGSPATHSPSISIVSLSDFTIADTSDDETPRDPTTITPHGTFYFEDGNVEVLCGNALFRVHTSVLSLHSPVLGQMFAKSNLATAESPNGCPRIPSSDTVTDFTTLLKIIYLPGFPERNKVPDFSTFSSLLRITEKYEMPTVRSQILEVIRDAYPVTFEGLDPSKVLGESVFNGTTPHPNAVLNLFVQQKLSSALPMAYYMAVRRGPDSLMDAHFPASARLSPGILQVAIKGLFALREMELREINRLILGPKGSRRTLSKCSSCSAAGPGVSEAHQRVIDQIADSSRSGTRLLQVLSLGEICGDQHGFCESCVKEWEYGHAEVRKKAWAALPHVFGLKT